MERKKDIFRWTGEFLSRPDEDRFLAEAWPDQARQIRFTGLIGGIIYFLAIIANYYNLGFCREFRIIFFFRFLVLIVGLTTARLSFRERRDRLITGWIVFFVVAVGVGELVEMFYMGGGTDYYSPAMIPLILIYYLFLPNPLALTSSVAVSLSLGHILALVYFVKVPLIHLSTVVLFFAAVNGLGIYFVRRTNQLQRREFHTLERLKEALEAKDVFLATMSHEFRTPLNAIIGLTDLALSTDRPPVHRENLYTIRESAGHLRALIDDLLDLAKIENDRMGIEKTDLDLKRLLAGIIRAMKYEAGKKGLDLSLAIGKDVPPILKGDLIRLRQVLVNLVGNAIKFTEKGVVEVRVEVERTDPEKGLNPEKGLVPLCFSVTDTGMGIPEEKQHGIFDRFSQADDSTTRKYGGTGLGLAISRRLVELMGGRIWVESRPGRGSCFSFRLSLEPGDARTTAEREVEERPFQPVGVAARTLKIVLAEDNPVGAKMMTQFLSLIGHDPKTAVNGRRVLELLADESFDLVLMDIEMPEMDGLEAARRIRIGEAGGENRGIKIVALTAHALASFKERAAAAGIDAFLTKPVDFNQLIRVMNDLFPDSATVSEFFLDQVRVEHKHLLPELLETLRDLGRQAAEAAGRKDFEALRRTGHTIKGTAAGFLIHPISDLGEKIEKRGGRGAPIDDLLNCLNKLLDKMETELDQAGSAA